MSKSNFSVIYPDFFRIVARKPDGWLIREGSLFYKKIPIATSDMADTQLMYGISSEQIITELFRVNGGRLGYYQKHIEAENPRVFNRGMKATERF